MSSNIFGGGFKARGPVDPDPAKKAEVQAWAIINDKRQARAKQKAAEIVAGATIARADAAVLPVDASGEVVDVSNRSEPETTGSNKMDCRVFHFRLPDNTVSVAHATPDTQ